MPLLPGERLGAYEIVDQLGAGGMGEVYRARDTRLQRMVAIKIVPAAVAGNEDALARFEREAQAVAQLSHPNILAIHDFGRDNGVTYAVMELLEGRSLAEVLVSGALPARKAIEYARQIAEGLAAAHDRGIVHRDIKPGNLFVNLDGRVTILDFGLARISGPPATEYSATVAPGTTPGLIVGTIGYMSPEQVRALEIDHRSDIFSFGTVLYEMVSGRRAFTRATPADTLSAILNADPADLEGVPIPPALDRIIRRCLEKEPNRRFQSTRDLGFALDSLTARSDSAATMMAPASAARSRVPVIAAACLLAGAGLGALVAVRRSPAPTSPAAALVRFQIPAQVGVPLWVAVSPSGESVAWGASFAGEAAASVVVRQLNAASDAPVRDTSGAVASYWRKNGRQLLVLRAGQMFSVDPQTGAQTPLGGPRSELLSTFRGASLGEDDQLLIGGTEGIVLTTLGTSEPVKEIARPNSGTHTWFGYPQWLPEGRMLYMARRKDTGSLEAFVRALSGGDPRRLDLPSDITRVIVDPKGSLLYGRSGALLAQRYNFDTMKSQGEPVSIAAGVLGDRGGLLAADAGPSDVLAYRSGSQAAVQFEWVDRVGRVVGKLGASDTYTNFDLSLDGNRVVALRRERAGPGASVSLLDDSRQIVSQIVDASNLQDGVSDPTWSPDGQRIAYRRGNAVVVRNTFGGEERKVVDWQGYPDSWSRDGRYLAVGRPTGMLYDLLAVRVDGTPEEIPLAVGVVADEPRFSPDGKWVAYHVSADDGNQVYVMPFPPTGEKFQVSTTGGVQPRWRGDGTELFFIDRDGQIVSVAMPRGNPREARLPQVLFRTDLEVSPINDQFAATADGSRFLIRRAIGGGSQAPINVILNWRQLLK